MVIGTGISLDIGLFYSSAYDIVCMIVLISGGTGGVFGHAMGRLLTDDEMNFLNRGRLDAQHFITSEKVTADLTDHRALKERFLSEKSSADRVGF